MTLLNNLMEDLEVVEKPISAEVQNMLDWLNLKYEKRLAIFPNILSNPIYQHTRAAKRLRVLGAAIEILRGGRYHPHIKSELIDDLIEEKNLLFGLIGKKNISIEMYEVIIEHLKILPQYES